MPTFTVEYAKDTSAWEEWRLDYQFGAFYIFPPTGVIEPIDALRQAHDPKSASTCQAHISLSEPLPAPLTEEQVREIFNVVSVIPPFEIRYGPLRSFPPYPGVCYTIRPEHEFRQLRTVLHSVFAFVGVALTHEHIAPHMTIAEFISVEGTNELLQKLNSRVPEGTFTCNSIEYAVPNESFFFERVLTIPLNG